MAAADSDYNRGEMEIGEQERTFSGFMGLTVWGSILTAMAIFYLTLVFAVGVHWMPALVGIAGLSILTGILMRLSAAWFATVIGLAFLMGIAGVIGELLARFVF